MNSQVIILWVRKLPKELNFETFTARNVVQHFMYVYSKFVDIIQFFFLPISFSLSSFAVIFFLLDGYIDFPFMKKETYIEKWRF